MQFARALLERQDGVKVLWDHADRFDEAGLFKNSPWENPEALQVPLVAGTLRAPGLTPVLEIASELRLLAVAEGRALSESVDAKEAGTFLDEVISRNLDYLFPSGGQTEAERVEGDPFRESNERLFELLAEHRGADSIVEEVLSECLQVLAQRPVSTWRVRRMIERGTQLARLHELEGEAVEQLHKLERAFRGPTKLAASCDTPAQYRKALEDLDESELSREAWGFADSMQQTGLVAPTHATLIRFLIDHAPQMVAEALGLDASGAVELEQHEAMAHGLIRASVFPTTAQCLLGFSAILERNLLTRQEVSVSLERLVDMPILPEVEERLLARRMDSDEVTADAVLLAGTLAILGLPLGIGQGRNPTCQSARGLSLWANHDPAHFIEVIVAAARDGAIELSYQGQRISSDTLPAGIAAEIDLDLDPVSIATVSHLDKLYSELMRRSVLYTEDAHKWVNPAMYGRWVQNEIASAFADPAQTTVSQFERFVRLFFATHHPDYNGGHGLIHPNPVGIVVTNHQSVYLGPHAVSIQRIDFDPRGAMRLYYYNPNNEGRQDWGGGVVSTVSGNGEEPGESSLPFEDFASRLYAFHYNPNEQGPLEAVPQELVTKVVEAARTSWGRKFMWL